MGVTPLQQALALFLAALEQANRDARTRAVFLDLVTIRLAVEQAKRLDDEEREP